MISIDLGTLEYYDGSANKFVYDKGGVVRFEYSLKVIYEWEAKWKKPFLKGELTNQEVIDFYMTMALDPIEERFLSDEVMQQLSDYIKDSHTATTFTSNEGGKAKIYTAEELYALMIMANIPIDFENRNFNRLMTLMQIIAAYNQPPKKMSTQDIYKQNKSLNDQRKAAMKSKG